MSATATIAPLQRQQALLPEQPGFRVVCVNELKDLLKIEPAWQLLADRAIEPNVFYEPWMLLPALIRFHDKARLEVYAVYADFSEYSRLVALVPFERRLRRFGLASRSRRLLRYYYCGLCTPLLDAEYGAAAAMELFQTLSAGGGVYEFDHVHADGPAMQLINQALIARGHQARVQTMARAMLQPYANADAYLDATFKKKKQRSLQKRENQLREHGRLHYDTMTADMPVEAWLDGFLALEASGWKGRAGTAFASMPLHADFFRSICLHAHARGRLEMHALRLNDKPIAYLCFFTAGRELYAFRTAYDERFSRYAPGVLLAIWHSCAIHDRPEVRLVDSCADPKSQLDNEIWQGRRYLAAFEIDWSRPASAPSTAHAQARPALLEASDSFAVEAWQAPAVADRQYAEEEAGSKSD
jgi:CelD/BcsL family acetyltransferase involved in cellulose biosynthesis